MVDDNDIIPRVVKAVLEFEGYTVLTAGDSESAIALYKQNRSAVALLLADVVMPNMNGVELADRVLQLEPQMRILFMSGSEDASHGFGCVRKPFTATELVSRVGQVLESC